MSNCHCPRCGCALPAVALPSCHVFAADVIARRTLEFLEAVLPVLEQDDELHSSHDRAEKLLPLVSRVQDAIDNYAEIRIGCATRVIDPQQMNVADWPPAPETERSLKQ